MTVLPTAIAGAISDTKPSSGTSSGAAMPRTPIGSFIASVTPRIGVWCTAPSHLPAHAGPPAVRSEDLAGVALIGARLFTADEELVGPINRREKGDGRCTFRCGCRFRRRIGHLPSPISRLFIPSRLQVFPHPLSPTLSTEARLPVAAESGCRVEQIRR